MNTSDTKATKNTTDTQRKALLRAWTSGTRTANAEALKVKTAVRAGVPV